MQQDLPLLGPSRQRPFSAADEQVLLLPELLPPELLPPEPLPPELLPPELLPPELLSPELVPPELVPPELLPPELEPVPSEEHAATLSAKRRAEESEAVRGMFMVVLVWKGAAFAARAPRHRRLSDVAPKSGRGRRFQAWPELKAVRGLGPG
jgi:hypothetical protein